MGLLAVFVCAKLLQSCPTLYNHVDCTLLGSSVPAILQARILEWVAVPFSRGSSWSKDRTSGYCMPYYGSLLLLLLLSRFSCVRLCATPETAALQAPPSLGFSRQEHWSGLPFPSPMHESEKWKWSCSVVSNSLVTPWTAAYQAPLSMGFARQERWNGLPLPSPLLLAIV